MANELHEHRLKRLHMRSMRRGIKEMDLILSDYAGRELAGMDDEALTLYDQLLSENDQDLISWITGHGEIPPQFADLIEQITISAKDLTKS